MAPDSTTSNQTQSSSTISPRPSTVSPPPYMTKVVADVVPGAVTAAILREGLHRLQADLDELLTPIPSPNQSSSTPISALVENERFSSEDIKPTCRRMRTPIPAPEKGADYNLEDEVRPLYAIQASGKAYWIHTCAHCIERHFIVSECLLNEMQTKIEELAMRGMQLVKDKAGALKAIRNAQHDARRQKMAFNRDLKEADKQRDVANQLVGDLQARLETSWWEVAALKLQLSTAQGAVKNLEDTAQLSEDRVSEAQEAGSDRAEGLVASLTAIEEESHASRQRLNCAGARGDAVKYHAGTLETELRASKQEVLTLVTLLKEAENRVKEMEQHATKRTEEVRTEHGKAVDELEGRNACLLSSNEILQQRLGREARARFEAEERANGLLVSLKKTQEKNEFMKQQIELAERAGGTAVKKRDASVVQEQLNTSLCTEALQREIRQLREENAQLANIDADCQALVDMRNSWAQEMENGQALYIQTAHELERRNTYLERRIRLYENGRARTYTKAIQSSESLVNTSRSRIEGRVWNLNNFSLRGSRRRDDVEEGTLDYIIRR